MKWDALLLIHKCVNIYMRFYGADKLEQMPLTNG